ncbi:TPA: hypothetical protein PNM70_002784 [Listeria monocytogenes]|uniref:hypothetical protein n=1 Tax=Listeria monocytogenes TaxID=1639 RepID=UPI0007667772|nr:hypothetical protein [Listeria monocytogenes]CWU46408.1 Uncharacterised protein [Listeria monocytogenes]HBL7338694.1 hypothetical protein [Listeria monocytogenes]HDI4672622.1 hypothetical protein [Listeria monocytogenes]HDI4677278.1 hypothetical protein [Listeria monocytogenes]HDI4785050.1 hypothetical protein [Listeria monocytogenes]
MKVLGWFYIIMIVVLAFCHVFGELSISEFNSILFVIIACAVSVNLLKGER